MDEINKCMKRLETARKKYFSKLYNNSPIKQKVLDQQISKKYSIYHGDCVSVLRGLPSNSIHYSIFSPPFASLFVYSNSERDMGNSTDDEFYAHFAHAIPQLFRVIKPGRLISLHCSDIPAMKERDGYMGLKDFPSIILKQFEDAGFIYHSKHIIFKNPLLEAVRTKSLGLMHKQIVKDSAKCRAGLPDYLITVRKPGENMEPVSHKDGFQQYIGYDEPKHPQNKDQSKNKYSHHVWQKYASPIWFNINQTDTLNARKGRDIDDERHICPLQLQVIERALELWTNKNDTVLSPFMGIGSEGVASIKKDRKFVGIELKDSYYKAAKYNIESTTTATQGTFISEEDCIV